jgi:hypothetical protein
MNAEEADTALASARATVAKLILPGAVREKAVAAVESLAAAVAKRKNQLAAAGDGDRTKKINDELRQIRDTNAASMALGESYRFSEAAAKLQTLKITTPEAAAVRDAHAEAWLNAAAFLEQVAKDLTLRSVEGVVERTGEVLRAMYSVNGPSLIARPSQGQEIKTPLGKASPVRLIELASDVLMRISDSDDFFRRSELIYCFALRTGLNNKAIDAGESLAAESRRFRERLSLLHTTEFVSANGFREPR